MLMISKFTMVSMPVHWVSMFLFIILFETLLIFAISLCAVMIMIVLLFCLFGLRYFIYLFVLESTHVQIKTSILKLFEFFSLLKSQ